jgi:hypothetical protein
MPPAPFPDRELLKAENINTSTGLATDYLNHYNEIAMMIATLGDIPDMRDSVLEWRPIGYAAHFRMTGLPDHDLAVAAYEVAPTDVKIRFLTARRALELAIIDVQDLIEAAPIASAQLAERAPDIFAAIARLGAVINGEQGGGEQSGGEQSRGEQGSACAIASPFS